MDPCQSDAALPLRCFPRRRGDGPLHCFWTSRLPSFPPQARGWTRRGQNLYRSSAVSPAGAGMDLFKVPDSTAPACFPRRRGDGPWTHVDVQGTLMFPPQARGWTRWRDQSALMDAVSPAGAGMDRCPWCPDWWPGGFSRRRGDGPLIPSQMTMRVAFPPQARGWTLLQQGLAHVPGVSPAGAGMDRPPPRQEGRTERRKQGALLSCRDILTHTDCWNRSDGLGHGSPARHALQLRHRQGFQNGQLK